MSDRDCTVISINGIKAYKLLTDTNNTEAM